jgi:hypothetical protein
MGSPHTEPVLPKRTSTPYIALGNMCDQAEVPRTHGVVSLQKQGRRSDVRCAIIDHTTSIRTRLRAFKEQRFLIKESSVTSSALP